MSDTMKQIIYYSKGHYDRLPTQFIYDMQKLAHKNYFLTDTWQEVGLDNVYGMLADAMEKAGLEKKLKAIKEYLIFDSCSLKNSEWLDHDYRCSFNRPLFEVRTYPFPDMNMMEKMIWMMIQSFRMVGISNFTKEKIPLVDYLGPMTFDFDRGVYLDKQPKTLAEILDEANL